MSHSLARWLMSGGVLVPQVVVFCLVCATGGLSESAAALRAGGKDGRGSRTKDKPGV
jgi:hypothetical protein